jgi:hypothetical protein
MAFLTGAFNATYDGLPLGVTEDGFEQVTTRIQEDIICDQYRGPLDGIFQGIRMQIRMVLMELNLPGVRRLLWPYDHDADGVIGASAGVGGAYTIEGAGRVGPIGTLLSAVARPLILTPCPGTSSALLGNPLNGGVLSNITYFKCVLSADAQAVKFSSSLRKLPVTLDVLPLICPEPDYEAGDSAGPACDGFLSYYGVDFGVSLSNPCDEYTAPSPLSPAP